MKSILQYINERFISKKEYILVYPWDELMYAFKSTYSDNKISGNGSIFCFEYSQYDEIKKLIDEYTDSRCTVLLCSDKFDKEEFIKKWKTTGLTWWKLYADDDYTVLLDTNFNNK